MEDLFARYDSLKNAEEARQQAWQQQIYREHPVLETLDRQKKALLVDQLKEIMQTPEQKRADQAAGCAAAAGTGTTDRNLSAGAGNSAAKTADDMSALSGEWLCAGQIMYLHEGTGLCSGVGRARDTNAGWGLCTI